jgi:hypothetical protein
MHRWLFIIVALVIVAMMPSARALNADVCSDIGADGCMSANVANDAANDAAAAAAAARQRVETMQLELDNLKNQLNNNGDDKSQKVQQRQRAYEKQLDLLPVVATLTTNTDATSTKPSQLFLAPADGPGDVTAVAALSVRMPRQAYGRNKASKAHGSVKTYFNTLVTANTAGRLAFSGVETGRTYTSVDAGHAAPVTSLFVDAQSGVSNFVVTGAADGSIRAAQVSMEVALVRVDDDDAGVTDDDGGGDDDGGDDDGGDGDGGGDVGDGRDGKRDARRRRREKVKKSKRRTKGKGSEATFDSVHDRRHFFVDKTSGERRRPRLSFLLRTLAVVPPYTPATDWWVNPEDQVGRATLINMMM